MGLFCLLRYIIYLTVNLFYFIFEKAFHYIALAALELTILIRLASISQTSVVSDS